MSSSPNLFMEGQTSGPRVGILRGVGTSSRTVQTDIRPHLPSGVNDLAALEAAQARAVGQGYAEGYAAGRDEAMQEIAAQHERFTTGCHEALGAMESAVTQLAGRESDALDTVADQAAALALRIAEIVLQREIATAVDPGMDAVARAIGFIPDNGQINIHLNPEDLRRIGEVEGLAPGRSIALVGDPTVMSGGCVIAVGATRIDAQVPAALERISEVLR